MSSPKSVGSPHSGSEASPNSRKSAVPKKKRGSKSVPKADEENVLFSGNASTVLYRPNGEADNNNNNKQDILSYSGSGSPETGSNKTSSSDKKKKGKNKNKKKKKRKIDDGGWMWALWDMKIDFLQFTTRWGQWIQCLEYPVYSYHSDILKYKEQFDRLGLSENEIAMFYLWYLKIDCDNSGTISTWELLCFLGFEKNRFTKRIFSIFDEDGNNEIDFREFVISMWNYCTLGKAALIVFTFDLYDYDHSGELDLSEIETILKEAYGIPEYQINQHSCYILDEIADNRDDYGETLDIEEFAKFSLTHPALLMPPFSFQDILRRKICGFRFWDRTTDKRMMLSNGKYVPISVLLETSINESVAKGIVYAEVKGKKKKMKKLKKEIDDSEALKFIREIGGPLAVRRNKIYSDKNGANELKEEKANGKGKGKEKGAGLKERLESDLHLQHKGKEHRRKKSKADEKEARRSFHIVNENPLAPKNKSIKIPASAVVANVRIMNLPIDAELAGDEGVSTQKMKRKQLKTTAPGIN